MESLKEHLHTKRPSLSKSSITTYSSILKNLYIKVFGNDNIDLKKFDEIKH